jgi:hypothetical protein
MNYESFRVHTTHGHILTINNIFRNGKTIMGSIAGESTMVPIYAAKTNNECSEALSFISEHLQRKSEFIDMNLFLKGE